MNILDILILRLSAKGFMPFEIVKLINDCVDIIQEGGLFSRHLLNIKLKTIGWKPQTIDDITYDLLMAYLAQSSGYKVIRLPLYSN